MAFIVPLSERFVRKAVIKYLQRHEYGRNVDSRETHEQGSRHQGLEQSVTVAVLHFSLILGMDCNVP